jgi:mycobactin peptide synthetase MbtE
LQPDPRWTTGRPCTGPSEGLHETVARTALRRPDAVALVSGRRVTKYGELNRTADAWAAELVRSGVAPGDCVPVMLPRSTELVTALLAVLKAGAAYAVLDPSWPARHLREVIGELHAPLLVARPAAIARPAPPVWSPPTGPTELAPGFRPIPVDGSDPCCVFFTSGTTGRPKGVLTPHRATARLFQPGGFARFTADTVMPLAAPTPWDAFSLELWSVLLNGGTSLIVDEPYLSAHSLRDGVSQHGMDTVWLTSSLFNMIVDEDPAAFLGLRQVMIGGERLSAGHVSQFLRLHPAIVLLNGYGPVESTVFATTHRVTEADCEQPDGIPLGRPVPGTAVHILDGGRSCAVGETGEICIAGDGLALSYLGDPALTDAKFTHVRLNERPLRVYRTGDLGAWGPGGLLHFRGRADRQLKIQGHRIEPAEVERQVERLPSVRYCRVLARRDDAGLPHELVAFCVPAEPGDSLENAASALELAIVAHQRPAAVVSVAAFPVTGHGKLDESALLAMAPPARAITPGASGGPADTVRRGDTTAGLVTEIFCAVLGRAAVPRDVPFMELGGNSLGAGRVCARLAARLDRPVPVSRLYQHPTVAALARWLRTAPPSPVGRVAASAEVPLTPMQLVYLTRHLRYPSDRTAHCLLTWVIEGTLDRVALESAITAVHQRHEPLRAAYVADPRPAARLADIPAPALEVLPSQPSVDAAAQALRTELGDDLEPTAGEVWRTALVPVSAGRITLFGCVVHHIAFDGWSESVLANDLAAAYNTARRAGEPVTPWPPSLATVHRRQAERLMYTDLAAQRDYLLSELTGIPALRWPADPAQLAPGTPGQVQVPLARAVIAGVDALAAEAGVTRFVVLLAQCAMSLAEVTGQGDLAVGVPVAQRHGGLEAAIGCHINMLCIRLRGAALGGGLAAIRETGRIVGLAFAAQDVPFGDVLQLVNPPPTDRPPLFQTLFALQDNAIPRLDLTGLRTTFLRQPYLELPLELHTELWPDDDGGMQLTVSFGPEAVPDTIAQNFAKYFTDRCAPPLQRSGLDPLLPDRADSSGAGDCPSSPRTIVV